MLYFFLFLLGLTLGSYANVVILRLAKNESPQQGRSRCLECREIIRWYDNIPIISFFLLSGRCRYCHTKLSWQYPLIELMTGIAFILAGVLVIERLGFSQEAWLMLLWLLATLFFLILIAVYDLRYMEIPVVFLWLANASTVIFLAVYHMLGLSTSGLFPHTPMSSLMGGVATGGFLLLLVYLSHETWMGWGDVWLGTWAGMIVGISLAQLYLTLAFVSGALVGLWFLYHQKKGLRSEIPFAPYLLFSLAVIFLMEWYTPEIFSFLLPWFPATM